MNEKSLFNVFRLCWDVILEESVMNGINGTHFNSEHCTIVDTADINFDILENRLAYTYKHGSYNILFFEKCFLNFLNDCSEFEEVFPQKKLKICSLSNGPGFDIIGLLCALLESNKNLKSFPKLNAINKFNSWITLYKALINKACENINLKFADFHIKSENVNLFQGDILLSTLPDDAKKCISKSNILLMVKVFSSSKATVNKSADSLRKIFLLLKPGTLIFFIGSKKDMNTFSRRPFLSNYVKAIYGPQTVVLENITMNENFSSVIDQKPLASGHAEFVVWQKRNAADMVALIKDFKENNSSKSTKTKSISVNELLDGAKNSNYSSDSESKLSPTISENSNLSDVLTGGLRNSSCSSSSDFDSINYEMKSDVVSMSSTLSQNSLCSIEEVTSLLDKVDLSSENDNASKMDDCQKNRFHNDIVSDLANEIEKKFYDKSLINIAPMTNDSEGSTINKRSQILGNSIQESKDCLNLEYVVPSATNEKLPSDTQRINDANGIAFIVSSENTITNQYDEMNKYFDHSLNTQSDPKVIFAENTSEYENSCSNAFLQEESIVDSTTETIQHVSENSDNIETSSLHSLVQKCESLVAAVEKLTISLKNDSSKSNLKLNSHCSNHICHHARLSHHCCCCIKIVHTCCGQKI